VRKAGETAQTIMRHQPDLLDARLVGSGIALLYNILSYKAAWVLQPSEFSNLPCGTNGIGLVSGSMLGTYRALFDQGFQPVFVSLEQVEAGPLGNYKGLMASASFVMTRRASVEIRKFVKAGGTLLLDSRFAWLKEDGYVDSEVPAYNLSSVVGGAESKVKTVDRTTINVIKNTLSGLNLGEEIQGSIYQSGLDPLGPESQEVGVTKSKELLRSLVINPFGKGWSIYVGTNVGYAYESTRDNGLARLILGVLQLSGVKRNVETLASTALRRSIKLRLLTNGQESLLFAASHSGQQNELLVKINRRLNRDLMQDLVSGDEIKVEKNVVKLTLKAKQVVLGRV
jgi:hypothetical protein